MNWINMDYSNLSMIYFHYFRKEKGYLYLLLRIPRKHRIIYPWWKIEKKK